MRHALGLLAVALVTAAFVFAQPADVGAQSSYDGNVRACNGEQVYLKPAEKRTLQLHNQTRADSGAPRLCIDQRLQKAARQHSADMIRNDYFSHTSQDGTTFSERVQRAGYTSSGMSVYRIAENIAGGSGSYASPESRHEAWMNSPGHRANILDSDLRHVGIGVAEGTYQGYNGYKMYTVDFGFRR